MLFLIEDTINGILMGSIYGLAALGLTLIFGVLKVINFAHGSLLMVGMYVAYWAVILTGLHPYVALLIVVPVMFLFGYLLQDIIIKPIFKAEKDVREPITVIIVTTGCVVHPGQPLAAGLRPAIPHLQDNPLRGKMLEFGDMMISVPKLWGFCAAVACTAAIHLFLQKTRMGRAMRATSLDRDAASLMGINQYKIYNIAFGIGTAVAGVAGVALVPVLQRLPFGRGALRHQVLHHCRARRAREHRRGAAGRDYRRRDRVGRPPVHGGHLDRGDRLRPVSGRPLPQAVRAFRRQVRLVMISPAAKS